MKRQVLQLLGVFAVCFVAAAIATAGYEEAQAKIKKVYSATSDGHRFVAYVVDWKGSEVIVSDTLARSAFKVGDTIHFLALKHSDPGEGSLGYTNLSFALGGRSVGNLTNKIDARGMRLVRGDLSVAKNESERFVALGPAAKKAFENGELEKARGLARELSALAKKNHRLWNYGNAMHDCNFVLGRIAMADGRVEDAEAHLLASADHEGSPQLNSFGPSMILAQELLAKGGRDVVLEYFERCRKFWKMGGKRLDRWTDDVKAGRKPNFGTSLR